MNPELKLLLTKIEFLENLVDAQVWDVPTTKKMKAKLSEYQNRILALPKDDLTEDVILRIIRSRITTK